ncbi:hypothetical protein JXL19_04360 [bacterium]|nr:hypothetical protein [bacterium]
MANINDIKNNDDGAVLVLTMVVLLIISILTLSFFYLQIMEVDLIAYETDYIQAFYLANAALEHGIKRLIDDPNGISTQWISLNLESDIVTALNLEEPPFIDYRHIQNQDGTITVLAKARVNNIERRIQAGIIPPSRFGSQSSDFNKKIYETIEDLKGDILKDATFTSINKLTGEVPLKLVDIEANPYGIKLLTTDDAYKDEYAADIIEASPNDERYAALYIDPENTNSLVKGWTYKISRVSANDYNNNELLFYKDDGIRDCYEWWTKTIDWADYSEFNFSEKRDAKTSAGIPVHPILTLKEGKTLVLVPGTYFFEELTLMKNSRLVTNGEVILFATKCIINEGAKMMGTDPDDLNKQVPENLIAIIATTVGSNLTPQIEIKGSAEVHGHILAPDGKTTLYTGTNSKTLVNGSIFTKDFASTYTKNYYSYTYQIGYEGWPNMGRLQTIPGSWKEIGDPNGIL